MARRLIIVLIGTITALGCVGCQTKWLKNPFAVKNKKTADNLIAPFSFIQPATKTQPAQVMAYIKPQSQPEQDILYRFELYHYLPRSANPRGKRVAIWPDLKLGKPEPENPLWDAQTGCYRVCLPVPTPLSENIYLIELTEVKENRIGRSYLMRIAVR